MAIFCCPLADVLLKCDGLCANAILLRKFLVTVRADRMAVPVGIPAMQYQSQLSRILLQGLTRCFASAKFLSSHIEVGQGG